MIQYKITFLKEFKIKFKFLRNKISLIEILKILVQNTK